MSLFTVAAILTRRDVAESMARNLTEVKIIAGPNVIVGSEVMRTWRLYGDIPNAASYDLLMRDLIDERTTVSRFEIRRAS